MKNAKLFAAILAFCCTAPLGAQRYSVPETALRTGKYNDAIAAFTKLAPANPPPPAALDGLFRSLMIVGRYAEAESTARRAPELANRLGEVLYTRGRIDEAATAFKQAIALKRGDR